MFGSSLSRLIIMLRLRRASLLLGLVATGLIANSLMATTSIVDAGGFEAFSSGNLIGQAGWANAGGGGGSATVQSGVVESGSNAVRVDRGALSDDRWAVPVTNAGFPNNRYIQIEWDMSVLGTGAASGFGPFFGVDSYRGVSGFVVLGSFGVDATTGDVLYQQTVAQSGGVLAETGFTVNFGDWNNFRVLLDFQEDEYSIYLNDSFLLTSGFVDGPANTFTDADIAAIAAGGDAISQNATGTAYFDNFRVVDISPADFDIDGDVDADDFATWEAAVGVNAGGDANLDGDTDGSDLLILQRDYDRVAPLSSLVASVPEPTSLSLLLLAALCCSGRGRR